MGQLFADFWPIEHKLLVDFGLTLSRHLADLGATFFCQVWVNFEPAFGRLWVDFGLTLGNFGADCGTTSGRFSAGFGFDRFGADSGTALGRLQADFWDDFWPTLEQLQVTPLHHLTLQLYDPGRGG